jgi:[acyl-carrier-protein] S-malonyltransferase
MSIALVFPGQGSQYVGMGLSLNERSAVAAGFFAEAERVLGSSFVWAMFHGPGCALTETRVCQPAVFAHGCAAVGVMGEINHTFRGSVAYGLSLGELTALWSAGVFDFATGLRVVAERGRLMQKACEETDGAMLCLIGGKQGDIDALCDESGVVVANVNCPGQVVVSGETSSIGKATDIAEKMPFKRALRLNVAGAYHSELMESASVGFEKFLNGIEFSPPRMRVLTNVTGEAVESVEEIKEMLVRQIISPVLFEKCCRRAMRDGVVEHFEFGPGRTLSNMIRKIDGSAIAENFDKFEDFTGF